jgi:hypothetical protein
METWMLMEYCERGSLEAMLRAGRFKLPSGQPNLPMIITCLLDIASGLQFPASLFHREHEKIPALHQNFQKHGSRADMGVSESYTSIPAT